MDAVLHFKVFGLVKTADGKKEYGYVKIHFNDDGSDPAKQEEFAKKLNQHCNAQR